MPTRALSRILLSVFMRKPARRYVLTTLYPGYQIITHYGNDDVKGLMVQLVCLYASRTIDKDSDFLSPKKKKRKRDASAPTSSRFWLMVIWPC